MYALPRTVHSRYIYLDHHIIVMATSYKHSETAEISTISISFFGKIKNAFNNIFRFKRKTKSIDHLEYYDYAEAHAAKLRQKLHKANASTQMQMYMK